MARTAKLLVSTLAGILLVAHLVLPGGRAKSASAASVAPEKWALYDPDPNHLWNRLREFRVSLFSE
jgi:hypothetical protein